MTIRFLLAGSFAETHPELTAQLRRIHQNMPALFVKLMPRSDRLPDEQDQAQVGSVCADDQHLQPATLEKLQAAYCRDTLHLPTRASIVTDVLRNEIKATYRQDYGIIVSSMGARPIKWFKKISFTDP